MASIINASTTSTSGLVQTADASGVLQLQSNGVTGLTVDTAANVTVNTNLTVTGNISTGRGTVTALLSGTAQATTSGTSIDFTGIPSWAKRITVMFNGVSKNGTTTIIIQMITASGAVTSGYLGTGGSGGASNAGTLYTTGFGVRATSADDVVYGHAILTLFDSTNTWIGSGQFGLSNAAYTNNFGGSVTLSGPVTGVRITTTGADTFDAGSVNIMYE